MKTGSIKKTDSLTKRLLSIWVILNLFFILSCSNSGSDGSVYHFTPSTSPAKFFSIAVPSATERYFGEKRDFYVVGYFEKGAPRIGNIRIELFRGDSASGTPVRFIESHVDETGVTPDSAIEANYAEGQGWNLSKAPDLINYPDGFLYPGNKVLVTQTYFAGIIPGGATKSFDTYYVDSKGYPLEDLTEGVYTLRVTAVLGNTVLQAETMTLYFKPIFKLFGAFLPANHESKFKSYAAANGYRIFLDPFAGYFFPEGFSVGSYKINKRWRPQNSLEVVNTVEGASYGTPDNAQIGFILYNLIETGTTSRLEIGKALLTGVIDSPNTVFFCYNIGEPEITYTAMNYEEITIEGNITTISYGDRLVLTRGEVRALGTGDGDNRYNLYDKTPRALDLNLSDGIEVPVGREFSVYGVVTPIATTVTETSYLYYAADNRITKIRYNIKDALSNIVATTTRDLNLGRVYIQAEPDQLFYSIFEFEHEFDFSALSPGTYTVELIGLDTNGIEVTGTRETFEVAYAN